MRKMSALKILVVVIVLMLIGSPLASSDVILHLAQEQYWYAKLVEVQTHRQAWSEQKITKYKIGIRAIHPINCSQELIVNQNVPIQAVQNTCNKYVFFTVDTLFAVIEKIINSRQCSMDVVYDEEYKFPKIAKTSCRDDNSLGYLYKVDYEIYSFIPIQ